ncbi:SDR family NAD(P)-dependent oxidoreductase (plasmid) [Brucella pituitosa]|uniref:SDR family NAD(P)-dependent oxidoreductase n=1 Tax=Brucella/Ochrobactrum group TaxID=2826938 RepID=UPI0015E866A5|nr:glucose 1-dehydrogenase [Ochrobactrum sp. POC9]
MFEGKIAIVTGASGGLGQAICLALAENGARVVAVDVSEERALAAVETLRAEGFSDAIALVANVSSAASVAEAFGQLDQLTDHVDILVNNAGVREIKNVFDLPPAEWDRVMAINLNGPYYCAREAAIRMRDRHTAGSIVNISSVAGLVGIRNRPAYCSSKHGVVGLTKNLAFDLSPYGIRVNAIAPGAIATPMTEAYYSDEEFLKGLEHAVALGNTGTPGAIAQAAVYLCSPQASFVTGVVLPVDGGFMAEKSFASNASKTFNTSAAST